jgi:hypothetical protein
MSCVDMGSTACDLFNIRKWVQSFEVALRVAYEHAWSRVGRAYDSIMHVCM